jgi:uncharacterized protein (DUF2225 family)
LSPVLAVVEAVEVPGVAIDLVAVDEFALLLLVFSDFEQANSTKAIAVLKITRVILFIILLKQGSGLKSAQMIHADGEI